MIDEERIKEVIEQMYGYYEDDNMAGNDIPPSQPLDYAYDRCPQSVQE